MGSQINGVYLCPSNQIHRRTDYILARRSELSDEQLAHEMEALHWLVTQISSDRTRQTYEKIIREKLGVAQ